MNQRERILALAVGALAVLMGGFYVYRQVDEGFRRREQTLERLATEKKQKERQVMLGRLAQQRLMRYQEQSLPPDAARARQLYTEWLLQSVTQIGFQEPKVSPVTGGLRSQNEAFQAETFAVSGAGSLEMLTRLLHQFYSLDYLHRIKNLAVTPRDAKTVAFSMMVEALSLPDAPESDALHQRPAQRLASADVAKYLDAICGRNMFGPPNAPPTLSVASATGQTNREVTITPAASDPDQDDKLTYSWESEELSNVRFDAQTGRLSWTPAKPGEYYVTLAVRDDGVPARTTEQRVRITVTDPPPVVAPPQVVVEDKPKYDQVQFTFVNGITEVNGERQVWMIDRRSGKSYWLREGDKFQIGSFDAQVRHIGTVDVELEWYNRRALVPLGENLDENKELKGDELINVQQPENAS